MSGTKKLLRKRSERVGGSPKIKDLIHKRAKKRKSEKIIIRYKPFPKRLKEV